MKWFDAWKRKMFEDIPKDATIVDSLRVFTKRVTETIKYELSHAHNSHRS